MKLQVPFVQLPIRFDAAALAAEIAQIEDRHWRARAVGVAGNSALTLVTTGGDPDNDDLAGVMRPTPHLQRLPKVMQVMEALGATWGRARLMKLYGQSEVSAHVDTNYYWRERMRVHVPIVTTPGVRFQCGDAEVNMAPGECWIFDTWRRHRVLNESNQERIHLVLDTVGGERLWSLIAAGRAPGREAPGWHAAPFAFDPARPAPPLDFETVNLPLVMSPWEMREHFVFLLGEAVGDPRLPAIQQALLDFSRRWLALWAAHGEDRGGWPRYRALLDATAARLLALGVGEIGLRNEVGLWFALQSHVFDVALADIDASGAASRQDVHGAPAAETPVRRKPIASTSGSSLHQFDRPVFIVSPPRSGSTLLFETLAKAPGVYSPGDESHALIEGLAALSPSARGWDSNVLTAADAADGIDEQLRQRFFAALRDRERRAPAPGATIRMLEKTPKNALRIPFLRTLFPDARFIWLYRDPRQVLGSMIDGWSSGDFVMYPQLPGWSGPPWSFLLTPGWRELAGRPLADIVAGQWDACMRTLLDDLQALPREHWIAVDHADVTADPQAQVQRVAAWAGWQWDRQLGPTLPLSRYTLTAPAPDKWRRHEAEIERAMDGIAGTVARALASRTL
ncbi:sulfotransferase [Arenimonas composti]|uniref:Aspartyl/asparaginy/proline hydroxylase domain-containing protein n=1 Tax=Arenimonas composti TR7-09 = DSM 18010 TaxID=1121013 RepID=A0A091BGZ2_9GAMM|nr:sulfotransferase [Arenimonas composti]KFN51006.1 hypothetical protein P873_04735 [Arenimonas composti TR7-09 = DSM 18010]